MGEPDRDTSPPPRVIRVFVSSTFLDMKAERDRLVKFTFPQLRELCESRMVTWGEVDLRWGVTDEQKAEGQVLPICLEEIRRCRPYFIGLLGERYGWIPRSVPPDVLAHEPWLAEALREGKSVTELEILHGVLRDPEMADHAFFYFRDPAFVQSVPESRREAFLSRGEAAAKLAELKQKIRSSGMAVREGYRGPKALGDMVLADMKALIDRFFPVGSEPDKLDREHAEHLAFARSRTAVASGQGPLAGVYIGRQEYFDRLDAQAVGDGLPLVVLGARGSGKSSLLANWGLRYRQEHADALVLMHFIGAGAFSTDWAAMLRRILGELSRKLRLETQIPDDPEALQAEFANALHRASATRRVVLILDGLNQLEDRDGALRLLWLPPEIPPNVRLIVSSLPGLPLEELTLRGWPTLEVGPLEPRERRALAVQYLAGCGKTLPPDLIERLATAPQTDNPLYLRAVLDELRLHGDAATLAECLEQYLAAETPADLYGCILDRYEQDYEDDRPNLVRDAMTLLWAARRGLTEAELLQLLGAEDLPMPGAIWSPLYLAVASALVDRSGLLNFGHTYLREAVEKRYLGSDALRRQAHRRLADYFLASRDGTRAVDELPFQLAEGGDWERLARLLASPKSTAVLVRAASWDTKRYWRMLQENTGLTMPAAYADVIADPTAVPFHAALAVSDLLDETQYPAESARLLERLCHQAVQENDSAGEACCLNRLGLLYLREGRLDEAAEAFERCVAVARSVGDENAELGAAHNLAMALSRKGDLAEAERLFDRCIEHAAAKADYPALCRALNEKADIRLAQGRHAEVDALTRRACEAAWRTTDAALIGNAVGGRADFLYQVGRVEEGRGLLREEQALCRESGDLAGLARSLDRLGVNCKARGNCEQALELQEQAAAIQARLGARSGLASALGNQAESLIRMGRLDEAIEPNEKSIALYREIGNKAQLATSLLNHGIIFYGKRDLARAKVLLEEAGRLYADVGHIEGKGRVLGIHAAIARIQGDVAEADDRLQEGITAMAEAGMREGEAALHLNRGRLLHDQPGRNNEALEEFDKALDLAVRYGFRGIAMHTLSFTTAAYADMGALDVAEAAACEWIRLAAQYGRHRDVLTARLSASDIFSRQGRYDEAERLAREAMDGARAAGLHDAVGLATAQLASVARERRRPEEAVRLFQEAIRLLRTTGAWSDVATCLYRQAQTVAFDLRRPAEARRIVAEAIEVAAEHGLDATQAASLRLQQTLDNIPEPTDRA